MQEEGKPVTEEQFKAFLKTNGVPVDA